LQRSFQPRKGEKLMLENLKVTDKPLKRFGEIMAHRTQDYLMENKKIDSERIFLVKTDALSPAKIDKALNSSIRLAIK
jgi:hypothetical protein